MSEFTAEFDKRELAAFQRKLQRVSRETPRIVARALNRAATTARAEGGRVAAKALGITAKRAKKRLWVKKAKKRSLSATITAGTRRIVVTGGRKTQKGLTTGRGASKNTYSRVWKYRSIWLQRLAGAAPLDPKGRFVVQKGRSKKRAGFRTSGYPIQILTVPSVAEAWTPRIRSIQKKALTTMKKTLDHELNRLGRK